MKKYPTKRGEVKNEIYYMEETDEVLFQIKTPVKAHYVPMVEESK